MEKNYYDILGVPANASDKQIRKVYRKLAKKCHPDLHPGDKAAEERFKKINEAYETLSDPGKRAEYDQKIASFTNSRNDSAGESNTQSANGPYQWTNKGPYQWTNKANENRNYTYTAGEGSSSDSSSSGESQEHGSDMPPGGGTDDDAESGDDYILFDGPIENYYSKKAYLHAIGWCAAIFILGKFVLGLSAAFSLIFAFPAAVVVFGLFLNNFQFVYRGVILLSVSIPFFGVVFGFLTSLLIGRTWWPLFQNVLYFLLWVGAYVIIVFIVFMITIRDSQTAYPTYRRLLKLLVWFDVYVYNLTVYSAIIWVLAYFTPFPNIWYIMIPISLFPAFPASREAENIAWDISMERAYQNLSDDFFEALAHAVAAPEKRYDLCLRLAFFYANGSGVLRNAQQCIRWSKFVLSHFEHPESIPLSELALFSGDLNKYNEYARNLTRQANLLLAICYSRSRKYRDPEKAKKYFDDAGFSDEEIAAYWPEWKDKNAVFEKDIPPEWETSFNPSFFKSAAIDRKDLSPNILRLSYVVILAVSFLIAVYAIGNILSPRKPIVIQNAESDPSIGEMEKNPECNVPYRERISILKHFADHTENKGSFLREYKYLKVKIIHYSESDGTARVFSTHIATDWPIGKHNRKDGSMFRKTKVSLVTSLVKNARGWEIISESAAENSETKR